MSTVFLAISTLNEETGIKSYDFSKGIPDLFLYVLFKVDSFVVLCVALLIIDLYVYA